MSEKKEKKNRLTDIFWSCETKPYPLLLRAYSDDGASERSLKELKVEPLLNVKSSVVWKKKKTR